MKKYLKIAWRSLWRNSRRTIITAASVFFGVFFSVIMTSVQQGSFENMIENMARFYSGYLQIQDTGFNQTRSINHSYIPSEKLLSALENQELVSQFTRRVETIALASNADKSFPSLIFGIDPEQEESISGTSKWLMNGNYLEQGSQDILVGKILAQNLDIQMGDSLVLIGQGYHGASAAGIYRVADLLDFPLNDLSKQVIYMDIRNCQQLMSMPASITSCVMMLQDVDDIEAVKKELNAQLTDGLTIYTWDELQPELQNLIDGKVAAGKLIKGLLFMIIGFGVWATIIMLMHERKRELGVMVAIGFQKSKLTVMMLIESALIGLLGIIGGLGVSVPFIWYLYLHPIIVTGKMAETYNSMGFEPKIAFSISPEIFYSPALMVFLIFGLVAIYPIIFIIRLKVVDAIKGR